jgi:hypothetical protein
MHFGIFYSLLPPSMRMQIERVDDETIGQFELYRRICNESV